MPWWGWIIIGVVLLCAELFAIDAQFYLVFIGIGAVIVGLGQLLGLDLPMWGQWLLFAALSIGPGTGTASQIRAGAVFSG